MYWVIPTAISFSALLGYGILLFITFRQGFQKRVNRLFALYLLAMLAWSFGALLMYLDSPSAIFWNRVMLSGLAAMPLTFFAFVRGFLHLERRPWLLYLGSVALLAVWLLNARGYLTSYLHFTANGLFLYEFGPAFPFFAANSFFFLGLAAIYLTHRYRQTKDPIEKNRLRYAFFGISVVMLGSSTNLIPTLGVYPIDITGNIVNALLLAYAIFRYQLLDISVVVRRGVLYSIPTIIISVGYLFTVFLAVNLFHNVTGYEALFLSVVVAAVIAVASQPLRDKLQDRVDKLFFREKHDSSLMLQKLSQTATAVLDLDRLTNMILDEIAATMHPTRSALLLRGSEGGRFMTVNQRGLDQVSMSLAQDHPLVQWLASHKTTLIWKEADALPQFRALWTEEREALAKIAPELFVPLLSRAGLIGILILGAKRAELPYSLDEQRTIITLANQTAIAIENARLFAEERTRATQLALLSGVGRKAAVLDLDKLMQEVASSIRDGFNYHSVSIFLIDEKRHEVVMRVMAGGLKPMVPEAYRQSWDEGIIGFVARTGSSRLANDICQDPYYVQGCAEHPITKAELCVPIKLGHKAIGVLDAQSVHLNSFDQEDLVAMEALSDWLAIAIENARLYQETRQRAEEMDGLYKIGLAIGSQLDLDTLLHSIIEQAVELLGVAMGGLYLYRPERDVLEWVTAAGANLAPLGTILRRGEGLSGKVWETGQPLIVDDYEHWAGRADVYNGQPYAAVVGVPVCWGDEFLGVLNVNVLSGTPRTFSLADAALLSLFATQAAIAIKNARLYDAAQQELRARQRAEGELRKSEQRYRSLVETAADVIFTISLDGRLTSLNQAFTAVTGWSCAEWLDKPFAPIVHPDDLPVALELFQRILRGEASLLFELRLLAKSGEYLVGQFTATPQIQDGKVVGALGVARDITERKRLEQRIAERTRELSALYDVTAVASESLDLQVTLERALERVLETLRCQAGVVHLLDKAGEVLHVAVHRRIPPELMTQLGTLPADGNLMGWMLEHGEPLVIHNLATDPRAPQAASTSGFHVYVGAPIRARGQALGVFNIFGEADQQFSVEDVHLLASIADHVGVAVENAQLRRQSEQTAALQERERLARELHDSVSQSLFSLTLFAEAAREVAKKGDLGSIDQHLSEVDTIARQSLKDMRLLVHELRPSALAEEGLVGALHRRLEAVERRLGIEARVLSDTLIELPAFVEDGLYHIAQEALNNTLKHASAASVTVHIHTEDKYVIMEVIDDGAGFAPDVVSAHGGMGLTNMRERATRLGGILTVFTQPGRGTTVQVKLKIAD